MADYTVLSQPGASKRSYDLANHSFDTSGRNTMQHDISHIVEVYAKHAA